MGRGLFFFLFFIIIIIINIILCVPASSKGAGREEALHNYWLNK